MGQLDYAAFLIGAVPPGELAAAAVRKLARSLRRWAGPARAPSDGALLAAFGASSLAGLGRSLAGPRFPRFWADRSHAPEVAALARELPGLAERAVQRAEAIVQRRFPIFGREVAFPSGRVEWRRDPGSGLGLDGRGPHPAGSDPKRVWALGRMDWAVALGCAAWVAPERGELWAGALVELTTSLLDDRPTGEGIHSASPMEVALRSANLACALQQLRGSPPLSGRFQLRCLRALWEHAAWVEARLEDAQVVPNNHLVGNLCGLLHVALLYPELPGAGRWLELARSGLAEQVAVQVLPDGLGFEGSTSYHRLLLELLTSCHLVARGCGAPLGPELPGALRRMFQASRAYLTEGGLAPQVGDNDSGRGLAVTQRESLDHAYLPSLGAALLADPLLKAEGAPLCDEAAFLLGAAGAGTHAHLEPTPAPGSRAFCDFGLACLRQGPNAAALRCGPTGQRGIGGHGHNDQLGLELWAGARPVVVDPGSPSYGPDPQERDRFRGVAAHSTVQVDGADPCPIPSGRPFALPERARTSLVRLDLQPGRDLAVGQHAGYARGGAPVWHRREVMLHRREQACLIVDELTGSGLHRLTSRFHLPDPLARLRALSGAERERLARLAPEVDWAWQRAVELGPEEEPTAVWVGAAVGRLRLARSVFSPGYDQRREAKCIEVSFASALPVRLVAAVLMTSLAA